MDARVRVYKGEDVIWELKEQDALAKAGAEAQAPGRMKEGDKFTYEFTGKHDHGDLERRKDEGGSLDRLAHFLSVVKEDARQFLTEQVKQDAQTSVQENSSESAAKKPKLDPKA